MKPTVMVFPPLADGPVVAVSDDLLQPEMATAPARAMGVKTQRKILGKSREITTCGLLEGTNVEMVLMCKGTNGGPDQIKIQIRLLHCFDGREDKIPSQVLFCLFVVQQTQHRHCMRQNRARRQSASFCLIWRQMLQNATKSGAFLGSSVAWLGRCWGIKRKPRRLFGVPQNRRL
jgi:hypothetical protein